MIRSFCIYVWRLLDPIYFSLTRLQYVCPDQKGKVIFRVRVTKYKGKDVILSDGMKICKNDIMLKIHLHNISILHEFNSIRNELSKGRGLFKRVLESMPFLAEYVINHPEGARIKGIIGITLINKGFGHIGFECVRPNNKFYTWFKKTTQLPIYFLTSSDKSNLKKHHAVYLMMSKEKLLEKYRKTV